MLMSPKNKGSRCAKSHGTMAQSMRHFSDRTRKQRSGGGQGYDSSRDRNLNSRVGDNCFIGSRDWYVWRIEPARTRALESSGTHPQCAEQDAADFKKVA